MRISVLTLFPKMFEPLQHSIIGRAQKNGLLNIDIIDIRNYSKDKHQKCDDTPYGGGAGMVMTAQPIYDAVNAVDPKHEALRIYMSPKGTTLNADLSKELAKTQSLLILCGHYEGIDQRVLDLCFDCEVSIGDYILTGGELAALVLVDAVARYVPNVLGSADSAYDESFSNGLLEYPHYTKPQEFMGMNVPEVLLSGNHKQIESWRKEQALQLTKTRRKDLLKD